MAESLRERARLRLRERRVAPQRTATGSPVTPNGGDITVQWDAAGIFTL